MTGAIRFGLFLCVLTSCASAVTRAPVGVQRTDTEPDSTPPPLEIGPADVKLAVNVSEVPYKPRLPPVLDVPGNVVWGKFRVCATTTGDVSDVTVVTSAAPEVDSDWMDTIRKWRYQPHLKGGQPVPFCYQLRLSVAANR
jgi:hypothetical protein